MSFLDDMRTASPGRQIAAALAAAVILTAALSAAYFAWFNKPYAPLITGSRAADAAAVVGVLEKDKIPYRLADQGATVLVLASDVDKARLDLASGDVPIKGMVGFELFDKSDMGLTEFAQRINYQRALQGELARTIMGIDAVDNARVHLMLAEPTIFRDDRRPSKAAVTVTTRAGRALSADTVQGIQRLVASAVPDLAAADVVVLDGAGEVLTGYQRTASLSSPQTQQQEAIEQFYSARIRQAIAQITPASVTVDVVAHVDPNTAAMGSPFPSLEGWTPATRDFALTVAIGFTTPLSPDTESQVRRAARDAAGLDDSKGDALTLNAVGAADGQPSGMAASPTAQLPIPVGPGAATPFSPGPATVWLAITMPVLLLLIGLAALLQWRRRRLRRLTDSEQRSFAERLQALLDHEDAHASSF